MQEDKVELKMLQNVILGHAAGIWRMDSWLQCYMDACWCVWI